MAIGIGIYDKKIMEKKIFDLFFQKEKNIKVQILELIPFELIKWNGFVIICLNTYKLENFLHKDLIIIEFILSPVKGELEFK